MAASKTRVGGRPILGESVFNHARGAEPAERDWPTDAETQGAIRRHPEEGAVSPTGYSTLAEPELEDFEFPAIREP